ncbi:hypothetical protein PSTT_02117, partial [Puccinia striiformis]
HHHRPWRRDRANEAGAAIERTIIKRSRTPAGVLMILDGLKMATNPWTRMADDHSDDDTRNGNGGSGSELPPNVLWSASLSAGLATLLSFWCIVQQLRNYRKPILQRFVVRILFMVPIYSISTLISLYSLDAAFFIDLIRDIYEAFVIYCFFGLLVEYLGGERSLLILIHGREATKTYNDGDLKFSNGYTYVSLGYNFSVFILSWSLLDVYWSGLKTVQVSKPAHVQIPKTQERCPLIGFHFNLSSRPMPKFLCIKGIIFFSFWQGFGISILVALGLLKSTRYPTETLSLAIQDTLICFEMPLFSILHLYAFSHRDFIEPNVAYCGRLPFVHAFRDSILGFKDVLEDTVMTLRGTGFSYKTFEPAEGALHHHGIVRERRVRAGLRYSAGGKQKYWLPMAGENEGLAYGRKPTNEQVPGAEKTRWTKFMRKITPGKDLLDSESGYAPLLPEQAAEVIHREGEVSTGDSERRPLNDHLMGNVGRWDLAGLVYGTTKMDRTMDLILMKLPSENPRRRRIALSRCPFQLCSSPRGKFELDASGLLTSVFGLIPIFMLSGDYNSPVVDASAEEASRLMRAREDGMLANHPAAPSSWKGKARHKGTSLPGSGTGRRTSLLHNDEVEEGHHSPSRDRDRRLSDLIGSPPSKMKSSKSKAKNPQSASLPEGCVDLFIEDRGAMEERTRRNRLKGEANRFTGVSPEKVFKVLHPDLTTIDGPVSSTDPSDDNKKILDPQQNPKVDFSIDLDPQNPPSIHDSTTPEVQMIVNWRTIYRLFRSNKRTPLFMSSQNANSDLNNHHHSHHPDGDQDSTTSQENHFKPGKRASLSSNSINQNPWEHY